MKGRGGGVALFVTVVAAAGCGGGAGAASDAAVGDGGPAIACLGSFQPTWPVIDPDDPVFSDSAHTPAEVAQLFADAKAQGSDAYRAYAAARRLGARLECAFCACGCAESIGHRSAEDCFKDLHGFT